MKRPIPDEFDHLYGGSQWFSISRHAATTLLDYTDRSPSFYGRMWMTFAPEECYVATVLVNLLDKDSIEPWNHRFIRWKYENGNRPANLGCEHFRFLLDKGYLFGGSRNPMGTAVYFSESGKERKMGLGHSLACFDGAGRLLSRRHQKTGGQQ